jgi:hypothetical protein
VRRGIAGPAAVLIACLAVLSATTSAAPRADGAGTGPARLEVVATGLNNPRKIFAAPGGVVYVAEAGRGGRDSCLGAPPNQACMGFTGSITRVVGTTSRRVVTHLWSGAHRDGTQAEGPAGVVVRNGTYYIVFQDALVDAHGRNGLGPDAATAGDLISTPPGRAAPSVLVNLASFEADHNPDRGAGPGPKLGNPAIDSDPYAVVPYRGGFALVDAAANDLLWLSPSGRLSVLAVFPTRREPLTKSTARRLGAPPSTTSIVAQAVPSSVAVGPDGALYVGELTGAPFTPGSARVWRVVPGRKPTAFASGFTNISDLAFAGRNLLVLEIASKGLFGPASSGALIRVAPDGSRKVVAGTGLVFPTGLAVAGNSIYISNSGLYPASGPGRHGELVRLPRALAA